MCTRLCYPIWVLAWAPLGAGYETWFANQSLTHLPGDKRWFLQRVLINATFWRGVDASGKCLGPVLFYTGNEGPVDGFYEGSGWMTDNLAPKLGALAVFVEARYYGESDPGDANRTWLSTALILADYASILSDAQSCEVVAFGGSYGGTLTTFFRAAYPSLTVGGVASSAPVGYYDPARWAEFGVSEYSFANIIEGAYSDCLDSVRDAIDAIRASPDDAVAAFGVCEPAGLGPTDPAQLFQYALESLPQLDYPYNVGGRPGDPVKAACELLLEASSIIHAAANVTRMSLGFNDSSCVPTLVEGPAGVPGDGPGPDPWGKQSCTETLHKFSSNTTVRVYDFNLTEQIAVCQNLYRQTPDLHALTTAYGGYNIPLTTTNLFFSNGGKDPWHAGGFLPGYFNSTQNHFCFMPNAAHHLDLRAPNPLDPPDVAHCRSEAEMALRTWLSPPIAASDGVSFSFLGAASSRYFCTHNCPADVPPLSLS